MAQVPVDEEPAVGRLDDQVVVERRDGRAEAKVEHAVLHLGDRPVAGREDRHADLHFAKAPHRHVDAAVGVVRPVPAEGIERRPGRRIEVDGVRVVEVLPEHAGLRPERECGECRGYQLSQCTIESRGLRVPGLKSVPIEYATGMSATWVTSR